jgi:hypothetical protein
MISVATLAGFYELKISIKYLIYVPGSESLYFFKKSISSSFLLFIYL